MKIIHRYGFLLKAYPRKLIHSECVKRKFIPRRSFYVTCPPSFSKELRLRNAFATCKRKIKIVGWTSVDWKIGHDLAGNFEANDKNHKNGEVVKEAKRQGIRHRTMLLQQHGDAKYMVRISMIKTDPVTIAQMLNCLSPLRFLTTTSCLQG